MLCIGLILYLTSAIFVWFGLSPVKTSIEVLKEEFAVGGKVLLHSSDHIYPSGPAVKFSRFYDDFPMSNSVPDLTAQVYAAASSHNVVVERGVYWLTGCTDTAPLCSYEMTLPVKGSYTALRGFFSQTLQELPTLSIDTISILRASANDPSVEAELKMTLYLRPQ
jgi:hypothetical protein